jgi:hypothetical protein
MSNSQTPPVVRENRTTETTTKEVEINEVIQRLDRKQAIFCLRAFMAADQISEKKMRAAIYIANEFDVRDEYD